VALTVVTAAQSGTAATTIVINRPSDVTDGDLMVMSIQWLLGGAFSTDPNGWTLLTAVASSSPPAANDVGMRVYYKHASSEPASYSAALASSQQHLYQMLVLRGQLGSSSAFGSDISVNFSTSANGAVINAPAVTISSVPAIRVVFMAQLGANGSNPTKFESPAGSSGSWTSLLQRTSSALAAATFTKTLAATSGIDAIAPFSVSDRAAAAPWVAASFAIRADPAFTIGAVPHIGSLSLLGVGR
jgi:hypothetical protein